MSKHQSPESRHQRYPYPPEVGQYPYTPTTGEKRGASISPQFVLRSIKRWWVVAVPIGLLLGTVAAVLVAFTYVPMYRSTAMLQISNAFLVFPTKSSSKRFVSNQLQLIRSPVVMANVAKVPEVARVPEVQKQEDRVQFLTNAVRVSTLGGSDYFQIAFECSSPQDAATVAKAITDAYIALHDQFRARRTEKLVRYLEDERKAREVEVGRIRENVRDLAKRITGKDPFNATATDGSQIEHPLASLQARITQLTLDVAVLEARIRSYKESMEDSPITVKSGELETLIEKHPEMVALQIEVKQALVDFEAFKQTANPATMKSNPEFSRLEAAAKASDARLKKLRIKLGPAMRSQIVASEKSKRLRELKTLESELKNNNIQKKVLEDDFKKRVTAMKKFTGDTLDLEFRKAELLRAEGVLELIGKRIRTINTERNAPPRIDVLSAAQAPGRPIKALPYTNMLLAGLSCFAIPFAFCVLWEFKVRRVNNATQLETGTDIPVVGEIATLPFRKRFGSTSNRNLERDLWLFEESIDSLRTGLVLSEALDELRTIAVTSAASSEGKTSVASQLAVSIARSTEQPTLLIDGDMRSPDVNNVFELDNSPGLAEVLTGEAKLADAVVTGWSKHLSLLPAGDLTSSPHKLLGGDRFERLLEEVREQYAYIVIDTPPVLAAGESLVLAKAADGSLICAMRDASRLDQVRTVYQRLSGANANPIGVVLNGVPTRRYAATYGYYGYSRT